jgi:hypothetical protein
VRPRLYDEGVPAVTKRTPAYSMRFAVLAVLGLVLLGGTASAGVMRDGQATRPSAAPHAQVPAQAAQGQIVGIAVSVSPAGVRCSASVRYVNGAMQPGLKPRVAAGGRAAWKWRVPLTAAPGNAKVKVACGRAGRVEREFSVVAKPKTPPKVTVSKQGFSMRYKATGGSTASFGVILRNSSPDEDALNVHVLVNFVGPGNIVMGTVSQTVSVVSAADTYNLGGSLDWQGTPTVNRLEIVVTVSSHAPKSQKYPSLSNVFISGSPYDPGYVGEVDGEVRNNDGRQTLVSSNLSMVILDAAGNVVGGGSGFTFAPVPPGARILFKASSGFTAIRLDQAASALISVQPSWRLGN